MSRRDGLAIAGELYQMDLIARGLAIDFEHRTLPTPYSGTYCFPRGYSADECEWLILLGMKAVDSDKSSYHQSKKEVDDLEPAV